MADGLKMAPIRFRTYLYYLLTLAVAIPFVVFTIWQARSVSQDIDQQDAVLVNEAKSLSNTLKMRVDIVRGIVSTASSLMQVEGSQNKDKLNRLLSALRESVPDVMSLRLDTASGLSVACVPCKNLEGKSNLGVGHKISRDHWTHISNIDNIYVSNVVQAGEEDSIPTINMASPALAKDGKVIGYAVASIDLLSLSRKVIEGLGLSKEFVWILDSRGHQIYSNNPETVNLLPLSSWEALVNTEDTSNVRIITRPETSDLVGAIEKIPNLGWRVCIFKTLQDRKSAILYTVITNLLIFLLVTVLTFAIATSAAKPLTSAVSKLMSQVRSGSVTPTEEQKVSSPEELVELQKAFCVMAANAQNVKTAHTFRGSVSSAAAREFDVLKTVFNHVSNPVVVTDRRGFIRFLNEKATSELGLETLGIGIRDALTSRFAQSEQLDAEGSEVFDKKSRQKYSVASLTLSHEGDRIAYIFVKQAPSP